MEVKEVMKSPYIIEKDIYLSYAAKLMTAKKIGSLILLEDGKISGIITKSDIIENFGKDVKVTKVMSKDVITISENNNLDEALKTMQNNKIKRLPVLDDKEQLVGIITLTDIANNAEDLEEEFFFE